MPIKPILAEETLGYVTAQEKSNTDFRLLVGGSKNCLIDFQKKVSSRPGYIRLGAGSVSLTAIRNGDTWHTSTGIALPWRFYDDELEVYLGTVDGVEINAWKRVRDGWSTTEKLRHDFWFDTTESLDLMVMVNGDANTYAWGGGVVVVDSASGTSITKKGNTTWAQNRFFASANKTLINLTTGNEHTYTGGEGTIILTGLNNITDINDGDILIQKVVTNSNSPVANRNNHTIWTHENQVYVGSEDDEEVHGSKNSDYTDFTFSSPRLSGEGVLLTLTDPTRAFASLGRNLLIFSGKSTIFRNRFQQLDIGGVLSETLEIKQFNIGTDQGAFNQETIMPVGDSIFYLTNEVALRAINDPDNLAGIKPRTFSTPIKPDFDAESWFDSDGKPDAHAKWFKNAIHISAPQSSRLYILFFIEDADGKTKRFWNPPQILPVGPMAIIDSGSGNDLSNGEKLHGHSNAVPETNLLFEGGSDGQFAGMSVDDKLPIDVVMAFAYNNYKDRARLKNFDEYYIELEITPATIDLILTLNYDFDGTTQAPELLIDGSDENFLEGAIGVNSLAQTSLATNPLGGLINPPSDARKYRRIFEIAKEDFFELQAIFAINDVDKFFSVIAHGANTQLSRRKPINIK